MGICSSKKRANILPLNLSGVGLSPPDADDAKGLEPSAGHSNAEVAILHHEEDLHDYYLELDAVLGKGRFGSVGVVSSRVSSAHSYAMKTVQVDDSPKSCTRELENWQELDHPFLIRLVDRFVTDSCIHFIMELCEGGDLVSKLVQTGGLREALVQRYAHKIVVAVKYMHSRSFVHRDIKPDNFLLLEPSDDLQATLKLSDFGLSKKLHSSRNNSIVGTAYYAAPEIFDRNYSQKVDSWSIGASVYTLLSAEPPFVGQNNREILNLSANSDLSFEKQAWKNVSPEARDFISSMMKKSPDDRMDVAASLRHPWLSEIDLETTIIAKRAQPKDWESNLHRALRFSALKFGLCYLGVKLSLLDTQEASALSRWFFFFDVERTGEISVEQFAAVVASVGTALSEEDYGLLARVVSFRPLSKDKLSFSLFASLLSSHRYLQTEHLSDLLFKRIACQRSRVSHEHFAVRLSLLTGLDLPKGDPSRSLLAKDYIDTL